MPPYGDEGRAAHRAVPDRTHRTRPRPRRPRAQPQERRRRHPARRAGRLHRRLGIGQVVAGVRHALRRSAAPLPRVGVALRAPAVPSARRAGRRRDRRAAASGGPAAAARRADHAFLGRQRHHDLQPAADALLARRHLSARRRNAPRRGLLAQHAAGRLPDLPRPRPDLRRHGSVDGARRSTDDPRARHRRLAAGLARPEPARHRRHARLRRRHAVAATCRGRIATGCSSPTNSRPCRSMPASRPPRRGAR